MALKANITNEIDLSEQLQILSTRYDEYIELMNDHQFLIRNIMELDRKLHLEEIEDYPGLYRLSEGLNHNLWEKIGAYMYKVPSNNLSRGWRVIEGKAKEIERLLELPVKQTIKYREERYNLFTASKNKLREYRIFFYQRIEILFRTYGILVTDKSIKKSLYPTTKKTKQNLYLNTYFMPGTNWKSLLLKSGKWWAIEKTTENPKLWMVINNVPNYNNGKIKEFKSPDLIVFIEYSEVLEFIIQILGMPITRKRRNTDPFNSLSYN